MTKPISDYTVDELSKKIEAIKAEREKTANALKRYEEELERKKQEASQGRLDMSNLYENWHKTLFAISKGEPIDIKVLLPLMKKGWVAMDRDKLWFWFKNKPTKESSFWNSTDDFVDVLSPFNIKSADNWETSLMERGL